MYRSFNQFISQNDSLDDSRLQRNARVTCEFEDYFDINEILMLSERTPVVVSKDICRSVLNKSVLQ